MVQQILVSMDRNSTHSRHSMTGAAAAAAADSTVRIAFASLRFGHALVQAFSPNRSHSAFRCALSRLASSDRSSRAFTNRFLSSAFSMSIARSRVHMSLNRRASIVVDDGSGRY